MPKTLAGAMCLAGFLLAILALALLVDGVFGWFWPSCGLVVGIAITWVASGLVQKKFEEDAKAAGFDAADIRSIQDEAERLNDEEYP